MKTEQLTYLDFLGKSRTRMAIPVFQRVYTWGVWQCEELWEDILRAGRDDSSHFIGSIVFTEEAIEADGYDLLYNIVDGQQRTTTMTLLLIALRDHLAETGGTAGGLTADEIAERYLYLKVAGEGSALTPENASAPADGAAGVSATAGDTPINGRISKFIAAPADRDTLRAIREKTEMPAAYLVSKCVVDNYNYFLGQLKGTDLDQLWRGLGQLFAIVVMLGEGDNPQLIFEGINSKGMSLATSDLLRNRLFFGNDESEQERLLETYWEPIEALFADDKDQTNFNAALRRWLVEQDSELAKHSVHELYSVFRKYIDERYVGTTEDLMRELLESCTEFSHMLKSPPMKKHLDWALGHTKIDTGSGHALFG